MTTLKLTQTTVDKLKEGIETTPITNGAGPNPEISWVQPQPTYNVTANPPVAPVAAPQELKVAIIGTAPSSRPLAPFHDPSWQIWACSAGNKGVLPRIDCWFEIHGTLMRPENASYGKPYVEWLNQQTFPVYMQDNSLVPRAKQLPVEALVKEFGPYHFTSSFAWMMAFAIYSGAKEMGLWGVDMASKAEYIQQRPGGHYFIQKAMERGIKVTVPKESDLLQPPPLYGFDESTPLFTKLLTREMELKARINDCNNRIAAGNAATQEKTYLEGALEDMDYMKSIWGGAQTYRG